MSMKITDLSMSYGKAKIIQDINLEIAEGELVALLGPSGSGKTTLLRLIAGLETPDSGNIMIDGLDATKWSVGKRKVGFVFQHYALFKHMTIFDNIAFGLRVRPKKLRPPKEAIEQKVMELLQLVQLDELASRYPAQLSGGQRQRVALARALAVEPKILLLDEPFGALDAKVRQELRKWLRRLHEHLHVTSIFVTHDQEEALEVADKVVVMNHGRIEQIGSPIEVYNHPVNQFVFSFLGRVNLFRGRFQHADSASSVGYIRPHDVMLSHEPQNESDMKVIIKHITQVGPLVRLEAEDAEAKNAIEVEMSIQQFKELNFSVGETVFANLDHIKVFQNA